MTGNQPTPPEDDTVKNLAAYRHEKPNQLDLFELLGLENRSDSRMVPLMHSGIVIGPAG